MGSGLARRILYVHHADVLGGAEWSLAELVRAVDRRRFEMLAALPGDGPLSQVLTELHVAVLRVPMVRMRRTRNPLRLLRYWRCLRAAAETLAERVKSERIDLVHANSPQAALVAGDLVRRRKVPLVVHWRDLVRRGLVWKDILRRCDRVVAVSKAVASCLDSPKVVVVANGVDAERFGPGVSGDGVRRELGVPEGAPVVIMVAQWVPWKRHDVFLEAARRVGAGRPECHFVLAGEDHFGDHPELARRIRRAANEPALRGRLHILGQRADMPALMAASDVLVLPSEGEPFGRVLIEAMAAGRPVVAARSGGPEEIVTPDCGVLVDGPDAEAFAEAIEELLADPASRRRMGEAGRQRVLQHYTARQMAAAMERLYEELLR